MTDNRPAGLCATCRHADQIRSARGSTFWRCRHADTNPHFPRYPRLPVTTCEGHEPPAADGPDNPGKVT